MFTCILIDDEPQALEYLEKLIKRYLPTRLRVLQKCESLLQGIEAIKKHHPDLVFLDINMPQEKGMQIYNHFDHIDFEIIFTTAYKEFMIDALRKEAHDYLLKPVHYVDLIDSINRFSKKFEQQTAEKDLQKKIALLQQDLNNYGKKIAIPDQKGYIFQNTNNIMYGFAQSNYTEIHTLDGKKIVVSKTLKAVEELLAQENFFRIHKSYLVNLSKIVKYHKSEGYFVELSNGIQLPVSTRNKNTLLQALTARN